MDLMDLMELMERIRYMITVQELNKERKKIRDRWIYTMRRLNELTEKEKALNKAESLVEKKKARKERNHKLYRFAATYNSLFGDVIINTPLEEIDKLAELTVTYVYVTSRLDKVLHDAIYTKFTNDQEIDSIIEDIIEKLTKD